MTLPRKNRRNIEVDAARYCFVVSTSEPKDAGLVALNLTVQIVGGQGRVLKAGGLITRDYWIDFPEVASPDKYPVVKPRHVATIIRLAISGGWMPEEIGAPFLLQITSDVLQA